MIIQAEVLLSLWANPGMPIRELVQLDVRNTGSATFVYFLIYWSLCTLFTEEYTSFDMFRIYVLVVGILSFVVRIDDKLQ